jgi:phosphoribosylformylglycinamidine synthase
MSQLLRLRGSSALSAFRQRKLHDAVSRDVPRLQLAAEYWHFAQIARTLTGDERARLERLLTYGPRSAQVAEAGELLLIVPRPGTISPWSSKASDIARHCGLDAVERIERGVAYWVKSGDGPLSAAERAALLARIHDRMTEAVLDSFDDASRLFAHISPQPLAAVDLAEGGIAALRRANADMGLALSDDEIEYLADVYARMGRNPTDVELMMFAQANSEHCRHKIFNAQWVIDGAPQEHSLFGMIRTTHAANPQGTIIAYADNAAVMQGARVARYYPDPRGVYCYVEDDAHILMKVETHNHPTAISPFPGASTGAGG